MRHALAYTLVCFGLLSTTSASSVLPPGKATLTILLKFDGDSSENSVSAMKTELTTIMKAAGTAVEFRSYEQMIGTDAAGPLVVVKFKGKCRMEPLPVLYDERGPLAFTHSSDGEVLPFSEVSCDRVTTSVHSALWGGDRGRADELLGRALGRVLAHEIYHILGNTQKHGTKGVAKSALSGEQLIADRFGLNPSDMEKMSHK
jgi:hypothetical protein